MLTRWDPFREMMSLRSQMDRLLSDWPRSSSGWGDSESGGLQNLPLDLSESDQAYTVCASIPGIKPEDLEISVQNNMLTIRGETKSEQEREGDRWHLRERRVGQFQRTIALPNNVDSDQVGAEYNDGVLTLTLPKSEEAKPRRINIQRGSEQSSQQGNGQQGNNQRSTGQQTTEGQATTNR